MDIYFCPFSEIKKESLQKKLWFFRFLLFIIFNKNLMIYDDAIIFKKVNESISIFLKKLYFLGFFGIFEIFLRSQKIWIQILHPYLIQ